MGLRGRIAAVTLLIAAAPVGAAPALARQAEPPAAAGPAQAGPAVDAAELARLKRRLATPTPIFDAGMDAPPPTFRVSVSEKIDIWKYWGDDPTAVAASVRPNGGTWHHEFQDMVTPDAFKGYGGVLGNGERLQLAATSLAFAGAMKLLGAGINQAREALADRAQRRAKEEVQRELAEFCAATPEACPAGVPAPPP